MSEIESHEEDHIASLPSRAAQMAIRRFINEFRVHGYEVEIVSYYGSGPNGLVIGMTSPDGVDLSVSLGRTP